MVCHESKQVLPLRHLLVFTGILSFLFGGCGKQQQAPLSPKTLTEPPEITAESGEGFHDLLFFIQDYKNQRDGSQTIRGAGKYNGKMVGLNVTLSPSWKAGSLGKNVPLVTYQGTVAYRSLGNDSDNFLQNLDSLYGTGLGPKVMRSETRFTGISLGGDPRDLKKGAVRIKLFFDSGGQADYAELFTNIELATHRLEIHEKDPAYRLPLVKALQAH